ncbi:hypothetical protein [Maricaulis sp.]|uniref:hypothetical protein n=1 Tax=Maricaulis sp. TaxID=1486257 RepID=UPI002616E245|nr:hypothetical protein [Maricaulis sp.]MDF1768880.1 hypothetical protein [Maricaulis sp.]
MKHQLLCASAVALLTAAAAHAGDQEWFPPDPPATAATGECYARVRIAPEYDIYSEQVTTQDSYERYDVAPPRLREEYREYISREAGMRYIVHEPVYESVTETVQIRPAYVEYEVVPAVHDSVTETILVREPRMVWRRGYVPGASMTRFDSETGEVWCLVEEAGEYQTVTRNIVVQPANIREVSHPAEYAQITRDVLVQEARIEEIPIAEERDSYRIQVVDQHATVDSHVIPVETQTVTRYSLRSEERWEWRLVDCEEINLPGYNPPTSTEIPPVASRQTAPSSQGNTYLYGTDMPADNNAYSEEVPVAQASYSHSSSSSSRHSARRNR